MFSLLILYYVIYIVLEARLVSLMRQFVKSDCENSDSYSKLTLKYKTELNVLLMIEELIAGLVLTTFVVKYWLLANKIDSILTRTDSQHTETKAKFLFAL